MRHRDAGAAPRATPAAGIDGGEERLAGKALRLLRRAGSTGCPSQPSARWPRGRRARRRRHGPRRSDPGRARRVVPDTRRARSSSGLGPRSRQQRLATPSGERRVDPENLGRSRAGRVRRDCDDALVRHEVRRELCADGHRRAERHELLQLDAERSTTPGRRRRARRGARRRCGRRCARRRSAPSRRATASCRRADQPSPVSRARMSGGPGNAPPSASPPRRTPRANGSAHSFADVVAVAEHRGAQDAEVLHPDERGRETATGERLEHGACQLEIVGQARAVETGGGERVERRDRDRAGRIIRERRREEQLVGELLGGLDGVHRRERTPIGERARTRTSARARSSRSLLPG